MAINPLLLNVKPISEITTVDNPTEGYFLFYDGSDELKKVDIIEFQSLDAKSRVFVSQPYPPYNIGDLWVQGNKGDIMRCKFKRLSGSYVATDWEKASKYTDDTRAIQAETNAKAYADGLKSQIDGELSDLEIEQEELISGLIGKLDTEKGRNDAQDSALNNLEGIYYTWSPTNRTLTLFDRGGNQLSQVSLVSLDNEGTDLRYNATTLSLDLYNVDNELLDSIPVSSFIGSVGTQLHLSSNQLQLKDSQGNILSTVSFTVSNIQGLQTALDGKLDKGTYTGNASDLKTEIDGKLNKGTYTGNASDLKNDIDNVQIGGRNLFLESEAERNSSFPMDYNKLSETLIEGKEYTISFEIKGVNNGQVFFNPSLIFAIPVNPNANEWFKISKTFVYVKNDYLDRPLYPHIYGATVARKIKLEKGNKATDWTPAPEDKQDRLQDITGNVGVGKTDISATEKLDVNGNVKASGFKTSSGTSSQFLMADGTVNSNTYAKTDGTNATDNWSNTSSGLVLNPTLTEKTLNASGQTVTLRDATYGTMGGIVQDSTTGPIVNDWYNKLKTLHNKSQGYFTELAQSFTGTEGVWHRRNVAGTISSWKQLYDDSIWNAASLSYSNSILTLTVNGIPKTVTINAGANYTAGTNITISGNQISVVDSPTFAGSVTATAFYESSLRELKENILPFELSGLGLISQLEIVTYDRIDKSSLNKIGIIADDSPEEFLSENKDAVDLYKTVFIQAKAIQE